MEIQKRVPHMLLKMLLSSGYVLSLENQSSSAENCNFAELDIKTTQNKTKKTQSFYNHTLHMYPETLARDKCYQCES